MELLYRSYYSPSVPGFPSSLLDSTMDELLKRLTETPLEQVKTAMRGDARDVKMKDVFESQRKSLPAFRLDTLLSRWERNLHAPCPWHKPTPRCSTEKRAAEGKRKRGEDEARGVPK